jgi:uncharacterized membrane protein
MPSVEELLQRWSDAGVVDTATAQRIRNYERGAERPSGLRWQVLLALAFGGILLAAGVSLFVAAHWDELSPGARFTVVLLMIVVLHGAAIAVRERFEKLAVTLHGVGTMAAGAAVFLVGQIFNIQEHWPAGILLWALCALAGWALLGDQVQQIIAMLLLPAWILCEWWARTDGYRSSELLSMRMLAVFAALYLTAFVGSKKKLVFGVLFAAGAIALTIGVVALSDGFGWYRWVETPAMPWSLLLTGWAWIVVVPLLAAWRLRPSAMLPVSLVILTALVLPHLFQTRDRYGYTSAESNVFAYLWLGLLACFFAWWGVRERSRALINYGIFAFAGTVLWFYFSSVMDKLGRSFSLIFLGLLFLGGGWLLEKTRRQLVRHALEAV